MRCAHPSHACSERKHDMRPGAQRPPAGRATGGRSPSEPRDMVAHAGDARPAGMRRVFACIGLLFPTCFFSTPYIGKFMWCLLCMRVCASFFAGAHRRLPWARAGRARPEGPAHPCADQRARTHPAPPLPTLIPHSEPRMALSQGQAAHQHDHHACCLAASILTLPSSPRAMRAPLACQRRAQARHAPWRAATPRRPRHRRPKPGRAARHGRTRRRCSARGKCEGFLLVLVYFFLLVFSLHLT